MKTLISYVAVAALILMSSFTINVQQELNKQSTSSCFNFLRVHRQGKANVALNWSVNSNDITQFVVERSYDGDFYENISTVSFNGSSSYNYMDNNVFAGRIYYRITAVHSDNTTECSPVDNVRIVQR